MIKEDLAKIQSSSTYKVVHPNSKKLPVDSYLGCSAILPIVTELVNQLPEVEVVYCLDVPPFNYAFVAMALMDSVQIGSGFFDTHLWTRPISTDVGQAVIRRRQRRLERRPVLLHTLHLGLEL